MKKISLQLAMLALLFVTACKDKETVQTETITENTTETVREEPADTVVVKAVDEAPDGTAVKVNGDGISVDSKNGENSVDIEVKK